jgi:lipopolysaccharide transport system permease protein
MRTSIPALFHKWRLPYLYDLVREMVVRDMKLRYKRSLLGIAWSLLNPLTQLAVFNILGRVFGLNTPNYPSFIFTGVLVWSWFQTSLLMSASAITDNRELIRRPGFPIAILPVITVTTNLIHFLLALPVLLCFVILSGVVPTATFVILPLVIALQFLLTLSLGYLVATFHVNFRDTQHLLSVFLMLLFYATPIFYSSDILPPRYRLIGLLNPMAHLVKAYRVILIEGSWPDLRALLILGILTVGLLGLGYTVFTRASYRFVEEL